mmetsp:Transcript_6788/g.27718  ORF Transcript_6788/g.27718 Transcript_6788/m.27718 type:complete len:203 (-) Transcript_6788:856-1464(-)
MSFACATAFPMYVAGVSSISRALLSSGMSSVLTNSRMPSRSTRRPRVSSFSFSYGFSTACLRITVWMGSASTSQLRSRSSAIATALVSSLERPFSVDWYAMSEYANPAPRLRSTVESVRSRCHRETGSLAERCSNTALAIPTFPSEFSKSMGLTLCGMVDEPTSPATVFCLKYPMEMYDQTSRSRSSTMVLKRLIDAKSSAM